MLAFYPFSRYEEEIHATPIFKPNKCQFLSMNQGIPLHNTLILKELSLKSVIL